MPGNADLTLLLRRVGEGDRDAMSELFREVYDELRVIAHAQRSRWSGNETLNTTAILHESFLKLIRADQIEARDRSHFFTIASRAMRQVLVNYARDQKAEKRGGPDRVRVGPEDLPTPMPELAAEQLIALDRALTQLEQHSERRVRIVECRFFAGLSVEETAEALGVSTPTVNRDWAYASRWLRERLDPGQGADDPSGARSV